MDFDFSQVRGVQIPEGTVGQISIDGDIVYGGEWTYTINIGDYVSSIRYKIDDGEWTIVEKATQSSVTLEVDGIQLVIQAYDYTQSDAEWFYTLYNNNVTKTSADDGGSITVYETRTKQLYTVVLEATYGHWENSSGQTIESVSPVAYGTSMSKSGTTLTIGSSNYYFIKNVDDFPYSYDNARIFSVPPTVTGRVTVQGLADKHIANYTLSISVTGGDYGTYAVTRTSSPYGGAPTGPINNGAIIYYGDVLVGTSSGNGEHWGDWDIESLQAPSGTSTGEALYKNFTIKNENGHYAYLYASLDFNSHTDAILLDPSSISPGATLYITEENTPSLDWTTAYFALYAKAERCKNKYRDTANSDNYTGTNGVAGNVTATFVFSRVTIDSQTEDIWSTSGEVNVKNRTSYTITWRYLTAYPDTWDTRVNSCYWGDVPVFGTKAWDVPPDVGNSYHRKLWNGWDNRDAVYADRTITALYILQHDVTISCTRCRANYSSGWIEDGTEISAGADQNYAFNSTGTQTTDSVTVTTSTTIYFSADYCYATFSGTHCTANKSAGWYSYGTSFTWAADRGYAFSGNSDTQSATMVGGSNTASASYTKYFTITWKYMSSYGNWTSASDTWNYGTTPSRSDPGTVSSGNNRYRSDNWDDLSAVYWDRTITRRYTFQYYASISGTRCGANISSDWYVPNTAITWTANSYCAFNSSGTTTTTSTNITYGGSYSASADYIYVSSLSGTRCYTHPVSGYVTNVGWYAYGSKIRWAANSPYCFNSSNLTVTDVTAVAGSNNYSADYVLSSSYSWNLNEFNRLTVNRTSSPYAGASIGNIVNLGTGSSNRTGSVTVYYGDVLSISASCPDYRYGELIALTKDGSTLKGMTDDSVTSSGDGYWIDISWEYYRTSYSQNVTIYKNGYSSTFGVVSISDPISVYADYTDSATLIFINKLQYDINYVKNAKYYTRGGSTRQTVGSWSIGGQSITKTRAATAGLSYTANPVLTQVVLKYRDDDSEVTYTNIPLEGVYWGGSC